MGVQELQSSPAVASAFVAHGSDPVQRVLMLLACVVWPIYVLPSGYPQLVSLILAISLAWIAIRDIGILPGLFRAPELMAVAALFVYTLAVNLAAALFLQTFEPLLHSFFYLQVLIGCIVVQYFLLTDAIALRTLHLAILSSLIVQGLFVAISSVSEAPRETGLFSNPNQLGFYALLSMALVLLLHRSIGTSMRSCLIGCAISGSLLLLSLSKAAIIAAGLLVFLYGISTVPRHQWSRRLRPLTLVVVPTAAIVLIVTFHDQFELIGNVLDRLASIGQSRDDTLAARGYMRIISWSQFLIFGSGEGVPERWGEMYELHSMFGTLLFSYGLPGTAIVMTLFGLMLRRNPRDTLTFVPPILLYSLTHQPMRQWMMWSLFLIIAWIGSMPKNRAGSAEIG